MISQQNSKDSDSDTKILYPAAASAIFATYSVMNSSQPVAHLERTPVGAQTEPARISVVSAMSIPQAFAPSATRRRF